MKTKNVILGIAMVLQMSIALGSVAQNANYSNRQALIIKELVKSAPEFLAIHSNIKTVAAEEKINLQDWMLSPEDWTNGISIKESTDPEIKLQDWMLYPVAMITERNTANEESTDSTVELQDWMLNPDAMSTPSLDEKVQLEAWMLNPTKW